MHIKSFIPFFRSNEDPIKSALEKFSITPRNDSVLQKEVNDYIDTVSKLSSETDRAVYIEKAAALIPLERLQDITHENALDLAQDRFKVAKYYLKTTDLVSSVTARTALNTFVDALSSAADSIISAFGIHRFFKQSRNDNENNFRANVITGLVSIVTLFTTILLPILGATLAAPIVGGLFLLISITGLIYPHIKPMPHYVIDGDNWTRKAEGNTLQRGLTNKAVIDRLAMALATNKKVIITGPSRVGKTQTAKDLTYAITERSKEVAKSLPKISQVFSWNSANLITPKNGDGVSMVQKIRDGIGRHMHKTLTVLDEFGKTCSDKKNNRLVAQLLTELEDKFDKVLAIATTEEYEALCTMHPSLKNRFVQFTHESLAGSDTEQILHHTLLQESPQTLVDGDALSYLVEAYERMYTKKHPGSPLPPQPHTAKELLRTCIQRVSKTQQLQEGRKLEQVRGSLDALCPKAAVENKVASQVIRAKYTELAECKKGYELAKERFSTLLTIQESLLSTKKAMNRTVLKIKELVKKPELSKEQDVACAALLLQDKLITKLEQSIKKEAALQHVRVSIDRALVDEVIREEFKS